MNLEGLAEKQNKAGTIYYENTNQEIVAKSCKNCGEVKSVNEYAKKTKGLGGRRSECKSCTAEKGRKYYEVNKETCIERSKKHNNMRKEQKDKEYLLWQQETSKEGLIAQRNHMGTVYYENQVGEILKKVCRTCDNLMSIENFRMNTPCLGGCHFECTECEADRARSWRINNPGKEVKRKLRHYALNKNEYKKRAQIWQRNNPDKVAEWSRQWQQNNPEKCAINSQRRLARKRGLPDTLKPYQYAITLEYFGNACALTGRAGNLEQEHAIPLSIGHGGTTFENCYPMANGLNQSKWKHNIFEWFEENRQRFELSQERFDNLIAWLASANAMTVEEYRNYVYWCHANPRDIDEIKNANDDGNRQAI